MARLIKWTSQKKYFDKQIYTMARKQNKFGRTHNSHVTKYIL